MRPGVALRNSVRTGTEEAIAPRPVDSRAIHLSNTALYSPPEASRYCRTALLCNAFTCAFQCRTPNPSSRLGLYCAPSFIHLRELRSVPISSASKLRSRQTYNGTNLGRSRSLTPMPVRDDRVFSPPQPVPASERSRPSSHVSLVMSLRQADE